MAQPSPYNQPAAQDESDNDNDIKAPPQVISPEQLANILAQLTANNGYI